MKFNQPTRRLLARLQNADSPQVVDATEPAVHTLAKAGLVEYEAYYHPDLILAWAAPLTGSLHTKPKSAPAKCDKKEYLRHIVESTRREQGAPNDMLDTICQLEHLLEQTESNLDGVLNESVLVERERNALQQRIGQLERENVALQSKLENQRISYGRRTSQLSAWGTARKYKLEHLIGKFRKLKAQQTKPRKENNMAKFNLDIKNVTLGGNVVVGDAIINLEVPDDLFTACVNNLTKLTEIMFSPPKSTCTCHDNDEDKRPPYVGKPDNAFAPMDTE